jgi:hypothetical protein
MSSNAKNVMILDEDRGLLYGHDVAERIKATGEGERVLKLKGVTINEYIAYLEVHFSDHLCVAALKEADGVSNDQLKRISETVELTRDDLIRLKERRYVR